PRGLGWAVIGAVVATLLVSGTYLISNVGPYIELLTSRSEDPQLSMGEAFRGSVAALKMLPDSAIVPAGAGPALLLVLGVVPAVILPVGRAAATWVAAWTALSFVAFSVAGYAASPWHLTPVVQPVLALGFVGWASALAPTAYPSRVRMLAHWVLAAGLVALWLPGVAPSPPRTATSPVASFSGLADRLVERTEQGQGLAYFEAQARCGMDWSPEATVLDLRLRSGAAAFRQTSPDAPLLALVEDVPSLQSLGLDGLQDRFVLPNGVAMKLYVAEQAGPWIDRFRRGCTIGDRSPTLLDVPMVVGGNAAPKGFETCVLPAPCPSYRTPLP
ncbi:MAG TPA: hypothetical protein DIU15_07205, partial [Deltaproteobacteria bacterium]|nr:hypothetical protein [Deltaproteobacteria bacterium]